MPIRNKCVKKNYKINLLIQQRFKKKLKKKMRSEYF